MNTLDHSTDKALPLPNFLIIGGVRCATGWMAQCLREHPNVFVAPDETHFFDRHYDRGREWWLETYFAEYTSEKAIGDKTASCLYYPDVPHRIRASLSDVRLICSLRDPIERLYSDYVRKEMYNSSPLLEAVEEHEELVDRSMYSRHLQRFFAVFPRDQILIQIYEDKFTDPVAFIRNIYTFLDVDPAFVPPSAHVRTKPGVRERRNPILLLLYRLLFSRHYTTPLLLRTLYSKLRPDRDRVDIDDDTFEELQRIFQTEIDTLEKMLDRRLDCWRTIV